MKTQVWYIGGGDSFLNDTEFHTHLQTVDLWHLEDDGVGTAWTRTLEEALGDSYEYHKIPMPNRENARYKEWKIWFERHFEYMRGNVVLVGLSLGAMFLAKYLSEQEPRTGIKALFLLAGGYDIGKPLEGSGDFLIPPEKAISLTEKYKNVIIMHSKDDFVVPYEHGKKLAAALPEAEFITFDDKNHFLIEEFPELIQKIKEIG